MMDHLLQGLYGVDAPDHGCSTFGHVMATRSFIAFCLHKLIILSLLMVIIAQCYDSNAKKLLHFCPLDAEKLDDMQ